jgi:glycosyltransferase involved in cell wall biosynthesis
LFTEVPELKGRFAKKVWERIEKSIFPKLKYVFTVNQSIADIFEEKYKVRVGVMHNFPKSMGNISPMIAKELGLPNEKKILILQGAGINIDRGAEEAVEMMKFIENAILLIVGNGDVIEILKKKIKEEKMDSKIFFFDKMPYNELLRYTAMADLGLSLDKDTNLNYRFSLPNKILDYVHAGTPVLASNLVEVKNIVENYQIGRISNDYSAESFAKIAQEMLLSNYKETHSKQLKKVANELCWENEVVNLKKIFNL